MSNVETLSVAAHFEPLTADEIRKMNAYWRACNYLSAGMLYLCHNLSCASRSSPSTSRIGCWVIGDRTRARALPGVHLNRLIKKYDLDLIYLSGPGHGAPATLSNCYLEGVYSEVYPDKSQDIEGMQKFFKQFSFPGGIGSHCTPETPGSIHEGGRVGLQHLAWIWRGVRQSDLIVTVVVGDGESETGTRWLPAGTPTNFSIRCATERFCRFFI